MALAARHTELINMDDTDLVRETYELVLRIDDPKLSDDFYWYLTEAYERFAPEAELAELQRRHDEDEHNDGPEIFAPGLRERQGARILRRLFSEGESDA
jgi:hypothetical protein